VDKQVRKNTPHGFRGTVESWQELPIPAPSLALPSQGAVRDGLLELPAVGAHEAVEIRGVTESMGALEGFVARVAAAMTAGGSLALEVENLQSPRSLRRVLEGKTGAMDPVGSLRDPSRPLYLPRLLTALQRAGFAVSDCVSVPSRRGEVTDDFAETLFDAGFLPVAYVPGAPPSKYWITARKAPLVAGSVLVAGDGPAAERTAQQLRVWLPAEWEVLTDLPGTDEAEQFSRGVARSTGQVLWLLRAGCRVDESLFSGLLAQTVLTPAVPGDAEGLPAVPGDVSGLMIPRADILAAGPLDAASDVTQVAYEEYFLRLDAAGRSAAPVAGSFSTPGLAVADVVAFERETQQLIGRWHAISKGRSRYESVDDPRSRVAQATQEAPWVGRRPRVSLCMITKDEEQFLGDCLAGVRGVVDEIVIVDTGSTDRTVEIAESFGAVVLHEPWTDDFSAPRNVGLEAATGDWILVLDADEVLSAEQAAQVRELVEDQGVSGYHLRFTNLYSGGKTQGVLMVRLFRNLPGVHYVNRIHEQVSPSLIQVGEPLGLVMSICDIEVVHKGYSEEIIESRGKNERNERLFKVQLEERPDDIYNLYKYGDFLRRIPGRQHDARNTLEKCLELILALPPGAPRGLPFAGEVAALTSLEYARDDRFGRANEILEAAFRRFTPTPNLHYIAASVAFYQQQWDEAIAHYQRCLLYRDRTLVVPIQEGITSYVSIGGIAQATIGKGDRKEGRRLLEQAIRIHPGYDVNQLALSRLYLEDGDVQQALTTLTRYLETNPDSAGACHQATLILRGLGFAEQAQRMGSRAIRLFENNAMDHEANQVKAVLAAL